MNRSPQGFYICPICGKPFILSVNADRHWFLDHIERKEKKMINPEKVNEIFLACLFNDDEIGEDGKPKNGVEPIIAEGIISKIGFHPDRLKKHEQEIIEMLRQLPHQFRKTEGGGWTFLNACNIEEGDQWTGLHQRMEQLFQLGIAIKKACWLLPREMWGSLPGSMPYVQIDI